MVVEVAARSVIGVDLGGTKLLAGAVDPERLTVHHRTRREVFGIDQSALLDAAVDAVKEASDAVKGRFRRSASESPALSTEGRASRSRR